MLPYFRYRVAIFEGAGRVIFHFAIFAYVAAAFCPQGLARTATPSAELLFKVTRMSIRYGLFLLPPSIARFNFSVFSGFT